MKKKPKWHVLYSLCFEKSFLTMKISFLLCFAVSAQIYAGTANSQQVSVSIKNASLRQVIREIEKQTNIPFLYSDYQVANIKKKDIDLKNVHYSTLLDLMLENSGLNFKKIEDSIVISPAPQSKEANKQQTFKVSGLVQDVSGNAIAGASVSVKKSQLKTVTDDNGQFSIDLKSKEEVLIISSLGKMSKEINTIAGQPMIKIVLHDAVSNVEDVVVTGYNTINKQSFTGTAIQITKEQLLQISSSNLMSALQVFDPSLRMMDNKDIGSNPNALPEFYIRGQSGFPGVMELDMNEGSSVSQFALKNNPNLPVFILDGFEATLERIYDLSLQRIKHITILKDAAATAMYGSRASNGVIVIETITPKPGQFRINYTANLDITAPDLSSYHLMNAVQKLDAETAAGLFEHHPNKPRDKNYDEGLMYLQWLRTQKQNMISKGIDTYWLSQPLSTMFNNRHNVYVEGGSEALRMGVDLRYDNQNGVMKESKRNRIGTGISLEYRHKGLQVRNQSFVDIVKSDDSPYGTFEAYTKLQPYHAIHEENGDLIQMQPSYQGLENILNPIYEATLGSFSNNKYKEFSNNLSANWYIDNYWTVRGQFAINYKQGQQHRFIDPASSRYSDRKIQAEDKGELKIQDEDQFGWNTNLFATYNRNYGVHSFNLAVGMNAKAASYDYSTAEYAGFPNGDLNSPSNASKIKQKPLFSDNKTRLLGGFANINYTINNIYLFDGSFRMDGSSEFGTDRRWAPFWSLGTGMNIHNYLKIPEFNILRVKANIGQTGKSNFAPYMARNTYNLMNDQWYATGIGAELIYMGNKNLTWEKQLSSNIGVDVTYRNRYTLELNYYNKETYDLISDVSLPSSSGFSTYRDNVGKVLNRGVEAIGNFKVYSQKNWDVIVFANIAHNKNKIVEIAESLKQYNDRVDAHYEKYKNTEAGAYEWLESRADENSVLIKPVRKFEEGSSLTAIYGMKSLGINPADGQEIYQKRNGDITKEWSPYEQVVIGNTEPTAQGAFGINVRFKQFSLYTSFLYAFGGESYNESIIKNIENVNLLYYNADVRVLTDRWQKPGDITSLKSIQDRLFVTRPTSRFVQTNNYLALNSASLMYDLAPSVIARLKLQSLRLGINMNDIARFSTIREERGLNYPFARTFSFTLSTTL